MTDHDTEACGCPRQGRPDGEGWHLDRCYRRENELLSRERWMQFMTENACADLPTAELVTQVNPEGACRVCGNPSGACEVPGACL